MIDAVIYILLGVVLIAFIQYVGLKIFVAGCRAVWYFATRNENGGKDC